MSDEPTAAVRVDRWLWAARFLRSRSLAARACDGGKVKVNGHAAKAHKLVRPGDHIDINLPAGNYQTRVVGVSEKRGPAAVARQLYEDLTPPQPAGVSERERGGIRPTKRQRRQMDRVRGW